MRKMLFVFFMLLSATVHADSWQEYWVKAVENCETKNYREAMHYFDASLNWIVSQKIDNAYHVYVDRARLHLLLEGYQEALFDVNLAISGGKLSNIDMTRALITRITALTKLDINPQQRIQDHKDLEKYDTNRPTEEITPDHIILRNIPDCDCYKKIMTSYFVGSGICEKESDVEILKSNIMIIKRKKCPKGVSCDCFRPQSGCKEDQENCEWYCDYLGHSGDAYCGRTFKSIKCIAACTSAVDYIKKGCYWCCRRGEFYKNCIEPYKFILDYIKEPCDPYWD